ASSGEQAHQEQHQENHEANLRNRTSCCRDTAEAKYGRDDRDHQKHPCVPEHIFSCFPPNTYQHFAGHQLSSTDYEVSRSKYEGYFYRQNATERWAVKVTGK